MSCHIYVHSAFSQFSQMSLTAIYFSCWGPQLIFCSTVGPIVSTELVFEQYELYHSHWQVRWVRTIFRHFTESNVCDVCSFFFTFLHFFPPLPLLVPLLKRENLLWLPMRHRNLHLVFCAGASTMEIAVICLSVAVWAHSYGMVWFW